MCGRPGTAIVLGLVLALLGAGSAPAAISVSDLAVAEGSTGSWQATITVTDDVASPNYRCVEVRSADGSATTQSDYGAATVQNVCLNFGAVSTTFPVSIHGDTSFEADETFSIEITNGRVLNAPPPAPPYPIADGHAVVTLLNDDVQPPPPSGGNTAPPLEHAWSEPEDCTIAGMQERYEAQFLGLMRGAARNLGRGGITELLAGRGKFSNVLTCPTGTLLGRVHKLRRGKPPLLLAAGRRELDYSGAGRTSVRLRLTKRGRSLLKGRSRLSVRATVRHVDLKGTAAQTRVNVTLTR